MLGKGQMSIAQYVAVGQMGQEKAHSPQIDTIHVEYGTLQWKHKSDQS